MRERQARCPPRPVRSARSQTHRAAVARPRQQAGARRRTAGLARPRHYRAADWGRRNRPLPWLGGGRRRVAGRGSGVFSTVLVWGAFFADADTQVAWAERANGGRDVRAAGTKQGAARDRRATTRDGSGGAHMAAAGLYSLPAWTKYNGYSLAEWPQLCAGRRAQLRERRVKGHCKRWYDAMNSRYDTRGPRLRALRRRAHGRRGAEGRMFCESGRHTASQKAVNGRGSAAKPPAARPYSSAAFYGTQPQISSELLCHYADRTISAEHALPSHWLCPPSHWLCPPNPSAPF
eukprot:IDg7034t1